jgi:hypothetical protein
LAANLVTQGFNVKVANDTDTDFWNMMRLLEPIEEIVLLAMPNQYINVYGAVRIQVSGLDCRMVAIAKQETEVEEKLNIGIPSFNLYWGTGECLEREAINEINLKDA